MNTRILHVLPKFGPGGAERIAVSLACSLDRTRFDSSFLSLYDATDEEFDRLLGEADIPVFRLGKQHGLDRRIFPRMTQVLRRISPHVVHTHTYALPYVWRPAVRENIPVVVHTLHSMPRSEAGLPGLFLRQIAFRCGVAPVTIAHEAAVRFRRLYRMRPAAVIPNGICVESYRQYLQVRDALRAREHFAPHEIVFISVAGLRTPKNPEGLLQAFASAARAFPEARLLFVGDGPLLPRLRSEVARLSLGGQVRFTGVRRDIPQLLAAADVFVLASRWEGNPLAIMEAMAAAKPVIATAVGGVPELLETGVHGMLVPAGQHEQLADAMRSYLRRPELAVSMGRAAAEHSRVFEAGHMVAAYERLYSELLEQSGVRPAAGGGGTPRQRRSSAGIYISDHVSL
jgi:glycosyltransferase involved in cell wall biosynthesis